MSKRRRMFEVELPADVAEPALETKSALEPRRGPMASAVRESAEAVRARAETEAAIRAENDRLAHELVRLRGLGLLVEEIPLDAIDTAKLKRDRAPGVDEDLEELIASIREIGLSNPIRVERAGERYELIQGWRRLQAFRALYAETGDERFARIPAGMVAPGDDIVTSYRRMVDENLVRKDISFAEMANLAREFVADPETDCETLLDAVTALYASAGKQKRSYIRAFGDLLWFLDDELRHPEAIPRNLGLEVRRQLRDGRPGREELMAALRVRPERNAEEELAILRGFVGGHPEGTPAPEIDDDGHIAPRPVRKAKTTFRVNAGHEPMRVTASDGKLELKGEIDFSGYGRGRLERAVEAFLAALDQRE